MFSYQLPTRSANQVITVADTTVQGQLFITLPNGESSYVTVLDLEAMLTAYKNEYNMREKLLEVISNYSTNALKLIVTGTYGKPS